MGAGVFLLLAGVGAWCLASDRPLRWIGRTVAARAQPAAPATPSRCTELPVPASARARPHPRRRSGTRWKRALLATVGRWTFDYLTLLARAGGRRLDAARRRSCCSRSAPRSCCRQIPLTPGRPRVRRGRADRHADARRRVGRRRGPGDVRVPPVLLLAAAARRPGRLRPASPARRAAGTRFIRPRAAGASDAPSEPRPVAVRASAPGEGDDGHAARRPTARTGASDARAAASTGSPVAWARSGARTTPGWIGLPEGDHSPLPHA